MDKFILGKKIKEIRLAANITQDIAAKKLGIPLSSFSAIENGKRKVDAIELFALANLYNINIEDFFTKSNNPVLNKALYLLKNSSEQTKTAIGYSIIGLIEKGNLK
ncbi:MAG: helix-turn-helix transcriptional regulator [Candidatus Gastranaerophilales bacterium]|nr:helix-turn-helix transcriptional regulator [Candidatus Gastranaerophilales bacterium]